MKSLKPVRSSKPILENSFNKNKEELSFGNIIKIPLAASPLKFSEEITKKLFALKDIEGASLIENRMPLRMLLNHASETINQNATLILSQLYKKEIYWVDLSQMTGKYIGETEKNLKEIFKQAQQKDWILFFDEADALFGKRTEVKDAHDKYANQEVSYLLQLIEEYTCNVIIKCVSPECLQLSSRYHFKTLG